MQQRQTKCYCCCWCVFFERVFNFFFFRDRRRRRKLFSNDDNLQEDNRKRGPENVTLILITIFLHSLKTDHSISFPSLPSIPSAVPSHFYDTFPNFPREVWWTSERTNVSLSFIISRITFIFWQTMLICLSREQKESPTFTISVRAANTMRL